MKINKICALGLSILAGCTAEVAQWTPAESPKVNKVERAVFTHHIHGGMSKNEVKKLREFLKNKAPNPYAINVLIEEHGAHSEQHIKEIEKVILLHGVPYDLISVESTDHGTHHLHHGKNKKHHHGGGVSVIIEKFVVIPPSCANFSEQIGNANQTHAGSNYGCSTEANIGMMIANPRDLLRGRQTPEYDGTVMAAGIKRYHDGQIKPLLDTSTTVPPGSQAATTPVSGSSVGVSGGSY